MPMDQRRPPHRTMITGRTDLATAAGDADWFAVEPGGPAPKGRRRYVGLNEADFESRRATALPPAGVGRLRWPVVIGDQGWVVTRDGDFVADASWFGASTRGAPLPDVLGEPHVLSGRCALLTSDWAGGNFGHFLLDLLPRLHLLTATGVLAGIDHVLVPHHATTEARTLLARTGLDPASLVELGPHDIVTAPEMVVTSFPGSRRTTPRWAARYLRQHFSDPPPTSGGPRLIYVARGEHLRAPIDEPALIATLGELGFVTVYPDRQPGNAVFATADVVVGANAAALANVVFCAPGTTLVELVPTDHPYPYFLSAALAAEVDYVGVGCTSVGRRPDDARGASSFDFTVDPDIVVPLLVELCRANRPGVSAAE